MPENAVPARVTVTGWLYQPFASGGRSGVAVAVGAETSTWSLKPSNEVRPVSAHVTEHDNGVSWSVANGVATFNWHPEAGIEMGDVTAHTTETGLEYHPDVHCCDCPATRHVAVSVSAGGSARAPDASRAAAATTASMSLRTLMPPTP